MAEEESELELDRFKKELESLLKDECGLQSKSYCERFCELVEEYTSRWQVPLPQLQVLRSSLCAFVRGAASFPSDCEHVRYTLSSLALSVFELLLFFGRDEFPENPLKDILDSLQECNSSLVRYQNVYLLQVRHVIRDGGPWASPVLEGILKEVEQRQEEVDRYISSEVSMFFELRVRYLLACERIREATALALKCSQHPTAGQCLFFKQAYLTCLWKSSQQERLFRELAEIDGKEAVEILCISENEEKDELLLELSRGFLLQQLRSGDMYYLWDLVFIWCKVYLRVKATENRFLQECKLLLLSATNVKAIFPFMKVILTEHLGKDGLTFCVELCAQALQTDLKSDPVTKSLIYKTIAYLFPHDLEICRACALLVFFLERTVEAYKTVFFLYNHPDLEYHLDTSPVGNNVRFEVIQILKKGLFFDPEFWSLLNIKTNCLKLMSDEVARAALCEITEDKWVPNYCIREHCKCHAEAESRTVFKQDVKPCSIDRQECGAVKKTVTNPSGDTSSESPQYKKRGRKPGTRLTKNLELFPVRRSFRQLDLAQNHARQLNSRCQRFLTRQAEKNILKRRGRKPRWLLEQLAALGENSASGQRKKPGRKPKPFSSLKDLLVDRPVIEITMEYSYPDNEVELPADVQGRAASKAISSTEQHFDQPQTLRSCITPNSLLQLQLETSPLSSNAKEDFQPQEVMVDIRKFHTYAKVPEEKENPFLEGLTDTDVLTTPHVAYKQEQDEFWSPGLTRNLSESIQGTKVTSPTAGVTDVSNGFDLPHVEQTVVPNSKITTVVNPPKDKTANVTIDNIQALKNTQEVSNLYNTPDEATEYISTTPDKGTDIISTSEYAPVTTPELAPQSSFSTPKEIPDSRENPPEGNEAVDDSQNESAEIIGKTPAVVDVAKPRPQKVPVSPPDAEVEPSQNHGSSTVSSAQNGTQPNHQCRLCNKKYEAHLSHALWHYRTEKKCMFCDKLALTRGALQHFQKHIKNLSSVDGLLKKCEEGVPEATSSPDQTVNESPPKKAKPGFAQIKSRLLMRLKLTRKTQPQREMEKSSDDTGTPLKETDANKPAPTPEPKESSAKENKQRVQQETMRYLTRGSVRKSEHKGRLLRTMLSRKVKARSVMSRRDSSAPKDASVPRVNGVIQKKRKMCWVQEQNSVTTDKIVPEKEDSKTDTEKKTRSTKANCDSKTKATSNHVDGESKTCTKAKVLEEPRVKKKKHIEVEENVDIKTAKKQKNEEDTSTATSTDTTQKSVEKQQNGTEPESSKSPRKRRVSSTPAVSCPIDACTFQATPGPVLSHVLIHHPGDTSALEFFYNLAERKCLFCARRIWTPQHFFDHVVSHRGNLKHPCYHVACLKRFKTRVDVSDHMEKDHSPLKARCCFAGCTVESASLKDLYSHEKSHYKVVTLTKDKDVDKSSIRASRPKSSPGKARQQADEVMVTEHETPPLPVSPDVFREQNKSKEDDKPLTLNRSPVNYSSKSSQFINGHTDNSQQSEVKAPQNAPKEQEPKYEKVAVKPFSRLPPSAYLDELYLSMPKKWRGLQASTRETDEDISVPVKRQSCSRCNATFDCEKELQLHRRKCTSLFGFDSDDENAS